MDSIKPNKSKTGENTIPRDVEQRSACLQKNVRILKDITNLCNGCVQHTIRSKLLQKALCDLAMVPPFWLEATLAPPSSSPHSQH